MARSVSSTPFSTIEKRDPGIVLVISCFTCGFYLIYWYAKMYDELETLTGSTPTGHSYIVDLLLVIVTCTLYGIWVDYKMAKQLFELQHANAYPMPADSSQMVVLLDAAAWITGFLTNLVSSAIMQDHLNKLGAFVLERARALPYRE